MEETMESTAYLQPAEKIAEETETEYTRSMKRHFPSYGIGCLLYSAFYAFCLYKNASGITYPFFVAGTLCCFFFFTKKLGLPFKKDSIFYMTGIILLGISNCMTASTPILFMNKCGIFLLSFILMLHTFYNDREWNLPKYVTAVFHTLGSCFTCLSRPFKDMVSYFDAQKQEETTKKSYFLPIITGMAIAVPLLAFMTLLLADADAIFDNMLTRTMEALNIGEVIHILFVIAVVFFASYALFSALCKKTVKEKTAEKTGFDPVIAIVFSSLLCILYLFFSVVQILYLFIGNMKLPENYTYASYAREGFFQLLAVSIINLLIVLTCLYLFRESKILRAVLAIICGCTFIMIFSSALRMTLYIDTYTLTFLRLFVLWALAVIFLLMAGVTAFIFYRQFPLFLYGLAVVGICYIALSLSKPDYMIARYDLAYGADYDYLSRLSADAAPAILDPSVNPYLTSVEDMLEKTAVDENGNYNADYYYDLYWLKSFYCKMEDDTRNMGIRNFNFSRYRAVKYLPYSSPVSHSSRAEQIPSAQRNPTPSDMPPLQ